MFQNIISLTVQHIYMYNFYSSIAVDVDNCCTLNNALRTSPQLTRLPSGTQLTHYDW